jgi:hypothetical protein
MLDIQFLIGGRRLEPCFIGDSPEKTALLDIAHRLRQRFRAIRIPDREDPLRIIVRGDDMKHLHCELHGTRSVMRQIQDTMGIATAQRLNLEI